VLMMNVSGVEQCVSIVRGRGLAILEIWVAFRYNLRNIENAAVVSGLSAMVY